ncbi:MAG: hypothetical protein IPM74_07615 [Crocinitomicaceae bacterium]|nr:hypothetical protein [Crocinitomicaceae bacterium]MBK8925767.1 hypothetical protein [Crocinitomicaceae bacterium]
MITKLANSDHPYSFPVYRKYQGIETYFKIHGFDSFTEIKKLGDRFMISEIKAEQFPEKRLILDMLELHENRWQVADKEMVEDLLSR